METASAEVIGQMMGQWRQDSGPLAERLGRRLVVLVDEGLVPDGAALPTERALAEALGVSRSTATAAYRLAKEAGRLESRQGAGTRARRPAPGHRAGRATDPTPPAFTTLGRPPAGVIDLSLAETRCDAHTRAVLDGLDGLDGLDPSWLIGTIRGTGYHPQGLPALRDALAGYLAARGHPVTPDGILVTTGAQQAIALAAAVCCPPGSTVLVEEASYPGALEVFRRLGLRTLPVATDASGPDPQALAALAARTRPAAVYLVPAGGNPTGVVVPGERLDALAEVLSCADTTVIEDRTAAPLADPATLPAPLATRMPRGTGLVVGSMSKIAWAGVRVGWLLAPPALLREALAVRISADLAGSAVSQGLATALVPHLTHLAAAVRADLAEGQAALRAALASELPEWSGDEPGAGAWRWLRIPGDARALAQAAATAGVLVTPGPLFSPHGLLTDRVRIACVEPPAVLVEGVRRLRRAWEAGQHDGPAATSDGRDLLVF